jgi:DNA-binding MarR family transcriptional regulator/ribosomal protein S18 acetylase RimI-like enzyme
MPIEERIEAVRRFNRFFTQRVGVLREGLLNSPYSLTEARVLYELARRDGPSASELGAALDLDAGYLSRILRGFAEKGLLRKSASADDRRQSVLRLTAKGRSEADSLNAASAREVGQLIGALDEADQARLVSAMGTVETILRGEKRQSYMIRQHRPGDPGWIVQIHGELYAREYGWDASFEALVAEIVATFIRRYDPLKERCWIAEVGGERMGSVLVVKKSATVAKLRLLILDPRARGLGIGARLVAEAIRFARTAGYRKMTLWTNRGLDAARHIYEKEGFRLIREEAHHSFGKDLVAQTFELELDVRR